MGSFFTNIQLRRNLKTSTGTITAVLDSAAREAGLARCRQDDQPADRTVIIRSGPGEWVSLYDEETEGQDTDKLDSLAAALSAATGGNALTVLVHDSDVLQLGLFEDGKKIDRVDSHPGYFSGRKPSKKAQKKAAGQPAKWKGVLAPGVEPEELASVWTEEKLFAEDTLARTGALLACPADRIGVGYRYLQRDSIPSEELLVLRYAFVERPAHEAEAEGPPCFGTDLPAEYALQPTRHAFAVGDELRVAVTCRNAGGPGKGVAIRVWGDAIDTGIVEPERFELLIGNVMAGAKHRMLTPEVREHEGGKLWMSDSAEPIPAGIKGGMAALAGMRDPRAMMNAMHRAQVHVNVIGKVVAPGSGQLFAALFPLEVGSDGAHVGIHDLTVDPPLYRPLRVRQLPAPFGGSHLVRPLSQRDVLVAMIVYGVDQMTAARHAASAFERFAGSCPPVERYDKAIFQSDPSLRPKTGSVKSKGLFEGKRWNNVVASFEQHRQVTLAPPFDMRDLDQAQGQVKRKGHGMAFGRALLPPPGLEGDTETPVLLLWARVEGQDGKSVDQLRTIAHAIVDEAMTGYEGVQGIVTRWGQDGGSLDSTTYEQACGINGPLTMLRSWSTRWLRSVGNDALWLGPDLRSRLDTEAIDRLNELAAVESVGPALRIVLRGNDDIAVQRLEEGLEALLPTAEQAREAQMALYHRKSDARTDP